nr:hypothetical protein 10 [Pseudomonadaceae bacterium]
MRVIVIACALSLLPAVQAVADQVTVQGFEPLEVMEVADATGLPDIGEPELIAMVDRLPASPGAGHASELIPVDTTETYGALAELLPLGGAAAVGHTIAAGV